MNRYDDLEHSLRRRPRRWVITGAAGFIGSHLLEALLRLDQEVAGLDNFATGSFDNLRLVLSGVSAAQSARFRFVEGDIRNPDVCRQAIESVDVILHEAALASVPRS